MSSKNMSSRLAGMKFMQRASAATTSTPSTPDGSRPSKRQRISIDGTSTPTTTSTSDAQAFAEAITAEEAKKNAFIERAAAEAGETKWVLSVSDSNTINNHNTTPSLRIVQAGYGAIDSATPLPDSQDSHDEEEDRSAGMAGRRSFGRFNKTVERQHNPNLSESESEHQDDSNSDSNSDSDSDSGSESEADALIKSERKRAASRLRADRKAQKKLDEAKSKQIAERRRSKEVNLNKVGGISGAAIRGKQSAVANMACHVCGQKGHLQRDCPDVRKKKQDARVGGGGMNY